MSRIAEHLRHAVSSVLHPHHHVDLSKIDARILTDLGLDNSVQQRAQFQAFRMGEPGASNAARLGANGR